MHLSLPKQFLLFILASVCWSLQCLISMLTQEGGGGHFFRLTCSVALWGGRDAANNPGVCLQCLSHTGPAPTHGACALPVYTAQALGCSAGNHPRLALGCIHFPGLSHSDSGTRDSTKVQTQLGLSFVLFPRPSSSGDQVLVERGRCDLSPPPSLPLSALGVQPPHLLRCTLCLFWGADLWLRPSR